MIPLLYYILNKMLLVVFVLTLLLGFPYFLVELYTVPDDSDYIESVSQGEVTESLHIRFVSDSDARAEVDAYGVYIDGESEPFELRQMDARLPRQSIDYPPEEESITLVVWAGEGEVLETHEVDL